MLLLLTTKNLYDDLRGAAHNPRVHNFGNMGWRGRLHAEVAAPATRLIDFAAYGDVNMRRVVAERMAAEHPGARVLDVGCGVGTLSSELRDAGMQVVGVDASAPMIEKATARVRDVPFFRMNAADITARSFEVDVAVACMLVHELPRGAHYELLDVLRTVTRQRRGQVWIVDIHPSYRPSKAMLTGEPYVLEYLATFEETLRDVAGDELDLATFSVIPDRVVAHVLARPA